MNRIKLLRNEYQLTQHDLAIKLNLSDSIVGLYENEARKPSIEVLMKMSTLFNCSIDYLLCKTDIRDINEIKFANSCGLDINGLDPDEIEEIKKQVEYMRWKKNNK